MRFFPGPSTSEPLQEAAVYPVNTSWKCRTRNVSELILDFTKLADMFNHPRKVGSFYVVGFDEFFVHFG